MAHTPHLGDTVLVRPLLSTARDEHGRPLKPREVAWSEHYQRSYDAGDIEALRRHGDDWLSLSADPPVAAAPAPAAAAAAPVPKDLAPDAAPDAGAAASALPAAAPDAAAKETTP